MKPLAAALAVAVVVAAVPVPTAAAPSDCWETFEREPGDRIERTPVNDDRSIVTVRTGDWSLRFLRSVPAIQTQIPEAAAYIRFLLLVQIVDVLDSQGEQWDRSATVQYIWGGRVTEYESRESWVGSRVAPLLVMIPASRDDRLGRHARLCR